MISKIHTSCKNCVFAQYHESTQIGCQLELLDKYHSNILAVYDKDKEFFVINNRICICKRTEEWAKNYPHSEWVAQVTAESVIKWHPIIFFSSPENLIESIKSIDSQEIPPSHVTVIYDIDSSVPAHKITKWVKHFKSWRVQSIEDSSLTRWDQVDLGIDKYKIPFYVVFDDGFVLEKDFSKKLNHLINYDMLRFGMIINNNKSLYIVSTGIHQHYSGSAFGIPLEEKIIEKCPQYIMKYENLLK